MHVLLWNFNITVFQLQEKHLDFSFYWDRDVDESKRVVARAKIEDARVKAEFFLPTGHTGDLEAALEDDGVLLKVAYGEHYLSSEARWKAEEGMYGVRGGVNSSVPVLNNVNFLASHAWRLPGGDDSAEGIRTKSKGSVSWNAHKHSAELDTQFGEAKARAELRVKSTNSRMDDIFVALRHEMPGEQIKTEVVAKYQNIEIFKFIADMVRTFLIANKISHAILNFT